MRAPVSALLLTASALVFISCAAPFRVAGIHTTGRVEDISTADIEAALTAYQASIYSPGPEKLAEVEVISHDEVRMHYAPTPSSYTAMVREKGKWVKGSVVLVHPIY